MTKALKLMERSAWADHGVVKSSSKSMEEVTRVRHFVGSSGKESRKERGKEVSPSGERVILPNSSRPER